MSDASDRPSLYELSGPELAALLKRLGQPRYRFEQVRHWLYQQFADTFDCMTNLPQSLRKRLAAETHLHTLALVTRSGSADGLTEKSLLGLTGGQFVESVLMHYVDPADAGSGADTSGSGHDAVALGSSHQVDRPGSGHGIGPPQSGHAADSTDAGHHGASACPPGRHTICISTQVGCAMGCVFCATGQMGLVRNLTRGECVEQLVLAARQLRQSGERLSNVVFMGMGEPLANWPATWGAVETLTASDGFALSPRRLTISTVGIVPGIRRLAEADIPVRLAVSLHAPDDELRAKLVPVNNTYGLDAILAACREYQARQRQRITFEYVLIDGLNDRPDQARHLARRLRGLQAMVNLIPLNPTDDRRLRPCTPRAAALFQRALEAAGVPNTLRMRRGKEIQAGCGQLTTRVVARYGGRSLAAARLTPVAKTMG